MLRLKGAGASRSNVSKASLQCYARLEPFVAEPRRYKSLVATGPIPRPFGLFLAQAPKSCPPLSV